MSTRNTQKISKLLALSLFATPVLLVTKAEAQGSHKVFNVQTYGATGNGTTDDTSAILKAIAAAGSNTGNTVYFPPGTYLYNSLLYATGVTFEGLGANLLSGNDNAYVGVSGTSPAIEDLNFHSNTNLGYAVFVSSATNFTINGSYFASGINSPIVINNSTGGKISANNVFSSTAGNAGIAMSASSGVSVQNNKLTVSNSASGISSNHCTTATISQNVISSDSTSNPGYGIYGGGNTGINYTDNSLSNIHYGLVSYNDIQPTLTSNTIQNTAYGISTSYSKTANVTKNIITSCTANAIQANNTEKELTISQNTISSAGSFGITSQQGEAIDISGNEITNVGLTTTTRAVIFVDNPGAKTISITANQYKGNATNLTYFIDAFQAKAVVSGNKTNTLLPTKVGK